MNVKIHEPHGSNTYCGPTIMSMLTGKSSDHNGPLDRELKSIANQRKNIRSFGVADMLTALNRNGFNPKLTYNVGRCGVPPIKLSDTGNRVFHPRKTLNQWLRSDGKSRHGRTFVVAAFAHWFLVQGNRYFDGPYGFDIDIRKAPRVKRRGRMICAIEVSTEPAPSWSELLDLLPESPEEKKSDLMPSKMVKEIPYCLESKLEELSADDGLETWKEYPAAFPVSEAEYMLSTYYEDGHGNCDMLNEKEAPAPQEVRELKAFIKKFKK